MPMELNQRKELFSKAYVRAVASVAGYCSYQPDPDLDSVDWGCAAVGGGGTFRSPKLEAQLKCTSREVLGDNALSYPLSVKNYDDLRAENYQVPRILIIVLVPNEVAQWLTHSEDESILKHCAYWGSLRGLPATENENTVTVTIPRTQVFNPETLHQIMEIVRAGGLP